MRRWGRRFLESTRGRVVQLLRRGRASVKDLAGVLDLTDNAVRSHLTTLERDGLVRTAGKRPGVRKPETLYALTPEADRLFPHAYHLLFVQLLERVEERMPRDDVEHLLREIGRNLAAGTAIRSHATLDDRAQVALDVLTSMGGLADVKDDEGHFLIQGYSCPLAAAVEHHPEVCGLAQALLEEILGVPVKETCDRRGTPRCAFQICKDDLAA